MVTPDSTTQSGGIARVVPLLRLRHLGDRRFDYLVPPGLEDRVTLGSVVRVPFGRRSVRAVVVETPKNADFAAPTEGAEVAEMDLRELESVSDATVPAELLVLAERLAERYLASYESCLRLVVPPDPRGGRRSDASPRLTWVERGDAWAEGPGTERPLRITTKQQALLDALPSGGMAAAELCASVGVGRGVLRALVDKGVLVMREAPTTLAASEGSASGGEGQFAPEDGPRLWPEQEAALAGLSAAYRADDDAHRVLWGVTGSGKTEIYLRLIQEVLGEGGGAILLVPEIGLTPQMISRVRARFGGRIGVLHSGLSPRERAREYRRIADGAAPVVVGARSAVFAPLPDLRLIIVDEAHDTSYKQDEEPRYHVATVARMRLASRGGLLVEGTATPAVESLADPIVPIRLTQRASGSQPDLEVVDMRRQSSGELVSSRAREALSETLRRGEQAIILLNRRGYAAHVHCESCGHVMRCTDCELSLTYHSRGRKLVCHQCGRAYFQPPRCPACGGPPLTRGAPGTERLDQELRAMVPRDRVFRMDSDVVTGDGRARAILEAFVRVETGRAGGDPDGRQRPRFSGGYLGRGRGCGHGTLRSRFQSR